MIVMFMSFYVLQEKAKYLFSFNFVALNCVLPQLEQVGDLSISQLFSQSINQ